MISERSEQSLALRPAPGRHSLGEHPCAQPAPPCFELDPGPRGFPSGWVLITGRLSHAPAGGFCALLAQTGSGEKTVQVPVSVEGHVHEVVQLPPHIRRLLWQPSSAAGRLAHSPLHVRPLGFLAWRWLMLRRVLGMLWRQPRERRREAGLRWHRVPLDLAGQYRACGRLRALACEMAYPEWIARFDALGARDRRLIRRRIERLQPRPRFALVVAQARGGAAAALRATLESIEAQLYPCRCIVLAPDDAVCEVPPEADYVAVAQAGDRLAEHALYWMAEAIVRRGDVAMAYADEDTIDTAGRRSAPRFKPDWSPAHLRSINYVGRFAVFRAAELAAAGGLGAEALTGDGHALNLRVARGLHAGQVAHVPAVLYHRAEANPAPGPRARLRHPLPERAPLVSILIPTCDAAQLLRKCVESVRLRTTYRNVELIVVDNRSTDPEALAYLDALREAPRTRVLRYDRPFNYAAINNFAVREARGSVLLLLNDDTEVITPDWLEEMLGHLHCDGVGVVGAKLLLPDGRVQHAGDAFGPGRRAEHLHAGIARSAPGYCHRAVVAQEVSAVTGACLLTWRRLYRELGGLDARHLPISFNDVDYCLRAQQAGWRVIFTPHAELYHHGSASRGPDLSARQLARIARETRVMRSRWRKRLRHDPYYNPNLCYQRPSFALGDAPRVSKPWLR